jgi:hypothetical protein
VLAKQTAKYGEQLKNQGILYTQFSLSNAALDSSSLSRKQKTKPQSLPEFNQNYISYCRGKSNIV